MEKIVNIVIPVCMQNDFIGPKTLANEKSIISLHGGLPATRRILGQPEGPTPFDDVMEVLHQDDNTYIIYIEDQHPDDLNDEWVQSHFEMFGPHCVVGTEGVLPVGRIGEFQPLRRSTVITTNALDLVNHPPVVEAITSIIKENELDGPSQVRFLGMGGLTDILIADLLRGLNHTTGIPNPYREQSEPWKFIHPEKTNVAVSEKFTFSNYPQDHAAAIRSMDKVFINVLRNEQEIFRFLNIDA